MKPVTYHYVRASEPGLPYFPYLSLVDFERQLDYFANNYGFVSRDAFTGWVAGGPIPQGVLLTFDDGLRDHVEFVLPVLRSRRLFGLFYVPSGPILTNSLLDVHKIHLVLGRVGGAAALEWLGNAAPELVPPLEARRDVASHYATQNSDEPTKFMKHLFNWQLSAEERKAPLDALLNYAFSGRPPLWHEVYLDERGVRAVIDAGMGVGAHGHTHHLLSRLSAQQEAEEIEISCAFIEQVGGSRKWGYCYPHGTPASFSDRTQRVVAEAGCAFAFTVAAHDIKESFMAASRYALPRYDCNAFPYGLASFGNQLAPLSAGAGFRGST
jgi:peptidoglycan/xylan/chitin deacetylase (PgdA/CDA1 family)